MPAGTARSSPVSARVGPYRFTSRSASIAGVSLINAPVTVRSQGILRIVFSTLLIASGRGGWFWFCARVNRYRRLDPRSAESAWRNEVNPGVHHALLRWTPGFIRFGSRAWGGRERRLFLLTGPWPVKRLGMRIAAPSGFVLP